jgi:hypothetical protein
MRLGIILFALFSTSAFAACGPNEDQPNNPYVTHFKCPTHRVVRTVCHKDKDGNTVCKSVESYEQDR